MTAWMKALALLLALSATASAYTVVHNFYGNVYDSTGAPFSGAVVTALIFGERVGNTTSTYINEAYPAYYDISVNADNSLVGENVVFRVNGVDAIQSASFESLTTTQLNITQSAQASLSIRVESGWNLISLPCIS